MGRLMSRGTDGGGPNVVPAAAEPITPQTVREGLRRGELFLEFLPLMALPDCRCMGAEALRSPGAVAAP